MDDSLTILRGGGRDGELGMRCLQGTPTFHIEIAVFFRLRQAAISISAAGSGSAPAPIIARPLRRDTANPPSDMFESPSLAVAHAALATLTRRADPLKADGRQTHSDRVRKNIGIIRHLVMVSVSGCLCILLIPLARNFLPEASFRTMSLVREASVLRLLLSCCVQSSHCIINSPALTVTTANAHLRTEQLCMQG